MEFVGPKFRLAGWTRSWSASLVAALAFAGVAFGQGAEDPSGWELVWSDEFSGRGGLDEQKWEALDRRDSYNNEKQYYHPDQVVVDGGELRLTAINTPRDGKAYQSGLITSKELFGPGRFEARIDLPTSQGMWPAFWLNANHVPWPQGGEIDIMENRGSQPTVVSSAYHWQSEPGPCCDDHRYVVQEYSARGDDREEVDFHAGFHTYAVEWDATSARFYVDGVLYHTVEETDDRPMFETPKNIILNLAVGGDFGGDPDGTTVWPQTMHVDYVRYWQPAAEPLSGDFNNDGVVDAADYTVWRASYGKSGDGLAADADGDGSVGAGDFELWAGAYDDQHAGSALSVPEPTSAALGAGAALLSLMKSSSGLAGGSGSPTP